MPRALAIAILVGLAPGTAHAVHPPSRTAGRPAADELTALPAAGVTRPLRTAVRLDHRPRPTAAWTRFVAAAGGGAGAWSVAWDRATGVPSRIWGAGIAAPGASASPAIAEAVARRVLADHLALLAPGAAAADFALAGNHSDGAVRAIGFVQRAGGRRVVGGQVSFRFVRDRLVAIASEALPGAAAPPGPGARLDGALLLARAAAELRRALALPTAPVTLAAPAGDEVLLPLVGDDAVLGYRVAARVVLDGGTAGRYLAYVDPATGAALAIHQQHRYATGTLRYLGVDRHPLRGRRAAPAHRAQVTVGGAAQTTTAAGGLTWTPDAAQTVVTSVVGDLVAVTNRGPSGSRAAAPLAIAPGGDALWDASADAEQDAQLQVFVAANAVKAFVRANLDPALDGLDDALPANVNLADSCNAFYDGTAINFMLAGASCQNTALIEDVAYHEYGHAVHRAAIVEGVGGFDPALSEGAADFLAASLTGDPGVARGFYYSDAPLRELDPPGIERTWPEDLGEIHTTGLIYSGALWDLRKAAIAALGEPAGLALTHKLFLATLRRATSIPTALVEALVADDDDGNLANGTPHECLIRAAFGRHGLRTAWAVATAPGALDTTAATADVRLDVTGLAAACPATDAIERVDLIWLPGATGRPAAGTRTMTAVAPGVYTAPLPLPADDTIHYSARVRFTDGTTLVAADNLGDPYYTLYRGPTVALYCTDFESGDPFAEGWTTGALAGAPSPWAWTALPAGGATDPPAAYSGTRALVEAPGGDYPHDVTSVVRLPDIDVGTWSDVHLQFRRWLATEDAYFDPARITVHGETVWRNASANRGVGSGLQHLDREWRFHDVRVSGFARGHVVRIAFEHRADDELRFGGWAIDDLCVVANAHSVCGDGVLSGAEQCDDGDANGDAPGACRSYCMRAGCGDGVADPGETCDDGPSGSATCLPTCLAVPAIEAPGCCSTSPGGDPRTAALVGLVTGAVLLRRRRRRYAVVASRSSNAQP